MNDRRISLTLCKQLVHGAGVSATEHVLSHLRWCDDEADARRSLVQLKTNRPEYFRGCSTPVEPVRRSQRLGSRS
jgi:hypothetical protein